MADDVQPFEVGNGIDSSSSSSKADASDSHTQAQAAAEENSWVEYEGVLTSWEMCAADHVDKCARKVCPFKSCQKRRDAKVAAITSPSGSSTATPASHHSHGHPHYYWWEGMSDKVPERYQRWEGIRERNTILSLGFGVAGYGRKQPTKVERLHLFLLFAFVWYLAYSINLRRRGRPCRKAWVEKCVPESLGGSCTVDCSPAEVLAETPEAFSDYEAVKESTSFAAEFEEAACLTGSIKFEKSRRRLTSTCTIPMCATDGKACIDEPDATEGFCICYSGIGAYFVEALLYTILFKLLYMPFWYLMVADLKALPWCLKGLHWCVETLVVVLYVFIFGISVVILYRYMNELKGFLWETGWYLMSFFIMCLFEVVKSFSLGFLMGTYVIRPLCGPFVAGCWKFMLA